MTRSLIGNRVDGPCRCGRRLPFLRRPSMGESWLVFFKPGWPFQAVLSIPGRLWWGSLAGLLQMKQSNREAFGNSLRCLIFDPFPCYGVFSRRGKTASEERDMTGLTSKLQLLYKPGILFALWFVSPASRSSFFPRERKKWKGGAVKEKRRKVK